MDTLNDIITGLKCGNLDPIEAHDRVLRLFNVSGQSEQLQPDEEANRCKRCNCYGCICDAVDGI